MTTEVMAYGTEPAARPEFASVARHMFKTYDDEGGAYCTACHRVLAGDHAQLAHHYRLCERPRPPPPPATTGAYACGACDATMDDGGKWTRHFGTRDHWRRYNAAMLRSAHFQPSHVHECEHCGVTFYRTEEYIRRHMFAKHDVGYRVDVWQRVMTSVYRARSSYYTGAMHCCAACGVVRAERRVHDPMRPVCDGGGGDDDDGGRGPPLEAFYCDTCRLTFVGDEDTYLRHAASPEHVALAENLPLWRRGEVDGYAADRRRWTVPAIVWRHFGGYPRAPGDDGPRACGLCGDPVPAADEPAVLEHLETCGALLTAAAEQLLPTPPSGKSAADYDAFRCGVCGSRDGDDAMPDFWAWSRHMTAGRHLMTPWTMDAYAYSDCAGCRTLYFGPRDRADDGSPCVAGRPHRFRPLPVADLMRFVYRETNADVDRDQEGPPPDGAPPSPPPHFYYEQATGQYGRCERSAEPGAVPFYCATCQLEFYGNRAAFRQHALTAEHMLLRQYAPFELAAADGPDAVTVAADADSALLQSSYGLRVDAALDAIADPQTRAAVEAAIGSILDVAGLQPPSRAAVSHRRESTTRLFNGHPDKTETQDWSYCNGF